MQKVVESILGRLATDPDLQRRFAVSPASLVADLVAQGLELTSVERLALAATDAGALETFSAALDRRLVRAEVPYPSEATSASLEE